MCNSAVSKADSGPFSRRAMNQIKLIFPLSVMIVDTDCKYFSRNNCYTKYIGLDKFCALRKSRMSGVRQLAIKTASVGLEGVCIREREFSIHVK